MNYLSKDSKRESGNRTVAGGQCQKTGAGKYPRHLHAIACRCAVLGFRRDCDGLHWHGVLQIRIIHIRLCASWNTGRRFAAAASRRRRIHGIHPVLHEPERCRSASYACAISISRTIDAGSEPDCCTAGSDCPLTPPTEHD
jgi:hypothetical protein